MCHIYFVSTAMDSWSGFRVHTVIFQHASVPLNSQPVFVSRSDAVSHTRSLCLSASFYVFVRAQGETAFQNKSRIKHTRHRAEEEEDKRDGEMKRKLITSKQMAPQFTVAPRGPGGTTLCTSGLPVLQRGVGHLNTTLCVCAFVC